MLWDLFWLMSDLKWQRSRRLWPKRQPTTRIKTFAFSFAELSYCPSFYSWWWMPRPTRVFGFYGNPHNGCGFKVEWSEGRAGRGGWQGGRLQDALLQTTDTWWKRTGTLAGTRKQQYSRVWVWRYNGLGEKKKQSFCPPRGEPTQINSNMHLTIPHHLKTQNTSL